MPPRNNKPDMPQDTWPITKDDKVQIRELGAKLNTFLHDHFKGQDRVHVKIVVGAFNYIMDLQTQKSKLIGDDFALADKVIVQNKLSEHIEEPFQEPVEQPEPTREERRKFLQDELAKLDQEEEIEGASPAPSESAKPEIETPAEAAPVAEEAKS